MIKNINILWIDSTRDFVFLFNNYIKKKKINIKIDYFQSLNQVLLSKTKKKYNILIIDLFLPDSSGIDTLKKVHEKLSELPVLVLTHDENIELAKECLINGVQDFLIKDKVTSESLLRIINYSLIRFSFFRRDKEFKNLIVENADGILIVNFENKILFANEAVGKIFEKKQYELIQNDFGYPVGLNEPINFEINFDNNRKKYVEIRSYNITWGEEKAFLLILRDFTIEKKQEKQLKIFKNFMNRSVQGFCLIDLEFKISNYNSEFKKIICENNNSIKRKKITEFYPDEIKEILENNVFTNVIADKIEKKVFYHFCNNEMITTLESFFLIKDENEHPQFIGIIITDITDQKKKELELFNNERRLFQFLENIPVGVFVIKSDGTPYFANKSAKDILGKGIIPDTTTDNIADVYNAYLINTNKLYPQEKMPIVKALSGKYTMIEDMEILKENEKIPIQVWGAPIYNTKNEIEYAVAVFINIKDRIIKEKEINILLTAINKSENIIIITDMEGLIKFVNDGFVKATGYTRKEVYGKNPDFLNVETDAEKNDNSHWDFILKGNIWKGEFVNKKKNGDIFYESAVITPIKNDAGDITHFVKVAEDITEKKKNEKEKELLQKQLIVSEKLSAIGELAAGVAHEFNNALAVIKSSTELLMLMKNMNKVKIDDKVINEIKTIEEHTKRASDIVSNLMSVAKPQPPKRGMNNIEDIINDVLKLQKKQFKLENIEIVKEYSGVPGIMIDRSQFIQVFINLIINARHAIIPKNKGKIHIKTFLENKLVKIIIKDSGVGIDEENINKIFSPFFTTKGAYSSDELNLPGTGLGLSITHKIISQHKGIIRCKSKKGEWTEFEIQIPLNIK